MPQNNPSHGTKVDLGKDAPVTDEGPGNVKSGSLAAESTKQGGAFSENKDVNIQSGNSSSNKEWSSKNTSSENTSQTSSENFSSKSTSENTSKSSGGFENTAKSSSRGGLSNEAQGGPAPTYVENQRIRDPDGPHGKNITEGIDEADLRKAKRPDPVAAAEQQFVQTELGGADQKPYQAGEKTAFDALSDTQA